VEVRMPPLETLKIMVISTNDTPSRGGVTDMLKQLRYDDVIRLNSQENILDKVPGTNIIIINRKVFTDGLIANIRKKYYKIPILVTGVKSLRDIVICVNKGATDCATLPCTAATLKRRIKGLTAK